jgi:hypothetical protein
MKAGIIVIVMILNSFIVTAAQGDNFSVQNGNPTFVRSLELQHFISTLEKYQPETTHLKHRLLKTIAYYKKIHILKTIKKTNYTIDCIPYAEQPALIDRPVLNSRVLDAIKQTTKNNLASLKKMGSHFDFNSATQCPLGSIGMMRPSVAILSSEKANKKNAPRNDAAPYLSAYFHSGYSYQLGVNNADELVSIQTEANQAYFKGPQNQSVVSNNASDHSLDQFWFTNRTYQQSIPTYSVEFGIMASAYFTNPASTSIFVFASIDNYGSNSCYNIICPNFVQFPNTPILGNPTNTNVDYIFQVTHSTLIQYLNAPAYYLTLSTHDASNNNRDTSSSILLGYYADSLYPAPSDLPQYFSAGAEVYADEPHDGTKMYGNYMTPYVGYTDIGQDVWNKIKEK